MCQSGAAQDFLNRNMQNACKQFAERPAPLLNTPLPLKGAGATQFD